MSEILVQNRTVLRLGTYDPLDDRKPVTFVGRPYTAAKSDLQEIREIILEFNKLAAKRRRNFQVMGVFRTT